MKKIIVFVKGVMEEIKRTYIMYRQAIITATSFSDIEQYFNGETLSLWGMLGTDTDEIFAKLKKNAEYDEIIFSEEKVETTQASFRAVLMKDGEDSPFKVIMKSQRGFWKIFDETIVQQISIY